MFQDVMFDQLFIHLRYLIKVKILPSPNEVKGENGCIDLYQCWPTPCTGAYCAAEQQSLLPCNPFYIFFTSIMISLQKCLFFLNIHICFSQQAFFGLWHTFFNQPTLIQINKLNQIHINLNAIYVAGDENSRITKHFTK